MHDDRARRIGENLHDPEVVIGLGFVGDHVVDGPDKAETEQLKPADGEPAHRAGQTRPTGNVQPYVPCQPVHVGHA
jgi:hypothetical protein